MPCQSMNLLDDRRHVVATACVEERDGRFCGKVDLGRMPANLRETFKEFETIVNDQIFSLLDQIEDRIALIPFVVRFDDGREGGVADLQIFPESGTISFQLIQPSALHARG